MGWDDVVAHTWRCRGGGASLLLVVRGFCKGRCVVKKKKKVLSSSSTICVYFLTTSFVLLGSADRRTASIACLHFRAGEAATSFSLSLVSFFRGATFRSLGVCAAKHNFVFVFLIFLSIIWFTLGDVDNGGTANFCCCCLDASHKERKGLRRRRKRRRRRPRTSPTGFCSRL